MNNARHLKVISRAGVTRTSDHAKKSPPRLISETKIATSLKIGEVVGRHKVVKKIGRGSIGDVYLCEDIELPDFRVALKVLAPHRVITAELKKRFKNEIATSARVNHRNVIRPYEFIQKRDFLAYTMEYLPAGDLAQWMANHKEFKLKEAITILVQVCLGVQAIHDAGIIHRDLKPQNILLTGNGEVRISDFAVSHTSDFEQVTLRGRVVGTIDYLSPQYLEHGIVTTSCDIYAVGAIAFEMFTHRAPLTGEGLYETLALKLSREPTALHEFNPDCPAALSAIVAKALKRDCLDRYSSAKEMAEDLQRLWECLAEDQTVHVKGEAGCRSESAEAESVGSVLLERSLSQLYPLVPLSRSEQMKSSVAADDGYRVKHRISLLGFTGGVAAALTVALLMAYGASRPMQAPNIQSDEQAARVKSEAIELGRALATTSDGAQR